MNHAPDRPDNPASGTEATLAAEDAIAGRRAVRAFLPDMVSEETVRAILDLAARAPSGTNIQPWHVDAVAGAAKDKLSRAVLDARERGETDAEYDYYPKQWREPYLARRRKVGYDLYGLLGIAKGDKGRMHAQFSRNYTFFGAPVGLFFTLDRDLELGSWMDMGMFLQNIMVASRARGLDTCPQAAWVHYHKVIREELGFDQSESLVCGMSLGYADHTAPENALVTEREPATSFARFIGF